MTGGSEVRVGGIVVAAGSGERFGDRAKVLAPIGSKPMLAYSLETLAHVQSIRNIVVVAGEHTIGDVRDLVEQSAWSGAFVCIGGETRSDSVRAGLSALPDDLDFVLVHDGARPFAGVALIDRVIGAAVTTGAAVPVLPVSDTVYRVEGSGHAGDLVERDVLRLVQTPQVARAEWLREALDQQSSFKDEGSALMACGYPVMTVPGCSNNIKITWPGDLALAEVILSRLAA